MEALGVGEGETRLESPGSQIVVEVGLGLSVALEEVALVVVSELIVPELSELSELPLTPGEVPEVVPVGRAGQEGGLGPEVWSLVLSGESEVALPALPEQSPHSKSVL